MHQAARENPNDSPTKRTRKTIFPKTRKGLSLDRKSVLAYDNLYAPTDLQSLLHTKSKPFNFLDQMLTPSEKRKALRDFGKRPTVIACEICLKAQEQSASSEESSGQLVQERVLGVQSEHTVYYTCKSSSMESAREVEQSKNMFQNTVDRSSFI